MVQITELPHLRHPGRVSVHRSVDRIVDVLDMVARADVPLTVSELARRLRIPRSSVQDIALGLVSRGWLIRTERGLSIGPAPLVLELLAARHVQWARIDVDAIAERFNTATAIAVLLGRHVVYTARSQRPFDERLAVVADQYLPRNPLTTAAGRLLLSAAPKDVRANVLRDARPAHPELVDEYERLLPTIRRRRTAWSDGLSKEPVAAVAVFPDRDDREALVLFGRRGIDTALLKTAAQELTSNGPL
ncbi:helix-turn-helix domain-containing protein [Microbacterium arborescens]|uniref:helix-turn-helix domain-containing protein n=1 Tax=Microbacterium arborescens TaxID=33883 RepID=UPI003520F5C3